MTGKRKAMLVMITVFVCAPYLTLARASVRGDDSNPTTFSMIVVDVGEVAVRHGENIDKLCGLVGRETFDAALDACTEAAIGHAQFVLDYTWLIERLVVPEGTSIERWRQERRAILAGFRRLISQEMKLASATERIERMFRQRRDAQQADEALDAIGYRQRAADITRLRQSIQRTLRALALDPSFLKPPSRLRPEQDGSTPPSKPIPFPQGEGILA